MKLKYFFLALFVSHMITAQVTSNLVASNNDYTNSLYKNDEKTIITYNPFNFILKDTEINTRFSEIGSGFYMDKLIMVSSKKIGGLAKKDPNTNEPYKELFCLDINNDGTLKSPYFFSRILNTKASEDQLSFAPNERTVYYTRSCMKNSLSYKIYKAELGEGSRGNWINNKALNINKENVSIENPFVNHAGDKLYFSANFPDSIGGYDLYVSNIKPDGTLEEPKNLGNVINTIHDDKYPSLSLDDKNLYFSSKGHTTMGGFDLFTSRINYNGYSSPKSLGNNINTPYDEIAFFLATEDTGYVSSNRNNGKGSYDLYCFVKNEFIQSIEGKVLNLITKTELPNTVLILKDENGLEIDRTISSKDATYRFNIIPFKNYTISAQKEDFKDVSIEFSAHSKTQKIYKKDIILNHNKQTKILVENIHFDFNKYNIKDESIVHLNKVMSTMKEHPEIKLIINAHTDNIGRTTYNLNLSKKRAKSAVLYLIQNGISKDRIISHGYGEEKPLINCKNNCSKKDLEANRRVDFLLKTK